MTTMEEKLRRCTYLIAYQR